MRGDPVPALTERNLVTRGSVSHPSSSENDFRMDDDVLVVDFAGVVVLIAGAHEAAVS